MSCLYTTSCSPTGTSTTCVRPSAPVIQPRYMTADFGRLGMATCFDANFPEVWGRLAEMGAEVVMWPSAYSAGTSLQAHAINHHYYIVTSSATPDCIAYDITGERLLYESHKGINVSRVTFDLDRGIYHENFNLDKRDKLLREHGDDVALEQVAGPRAMVRAEGKAARCKCESVGQTIRPRRTPALS